MQATRNAPPAQPAPPAAAEPSIRDPNDVKFRFALERTLLHEGGYVHDPLDPGGETHFGISKRSYPALDISNLTRADAEKIYFRDWWQRHRYGAISDAEIAAKVFDLAVNLGPSPAHRLLQAALCETLDGPVVVVDGRLGDATLAAVNGHPEPRYLLAALKLRAVARYLQIGKARFLAGWIKRAIA